MVTPEKPAWPSIDPLPTSIYEHILPALNTNQTMVEIIKTNTQKDKQPSIDILLTHFNGLGNAFTQIRDDFKEQSILDVIQNLSDHTKRSSST